MQMQDALKRLNKRCSCDYAEALKQMQYAVAITLKR
jgi:hypothetical protein